MSGLLLNVLFVKLSVGQVLSPLLQSRWERREKRESDSGLLGRGERGSPHRAGQETGSAQDKVEGGQEVKGQGHRQSKE